MLYVVIPPNWLKDKEYARPEQGYFSFEELLKFNEKGYNCYYYPNYPSEPVTTFVKGSQIDVFEWVFADFDLKEKKHNSKEDFLNFVFENSLIPTKIIDTGNGIHVYWKVSDLDAMSYLRLQRRICRQYGTDEAVCQIKQLMRVPSTLNMKDQNNPKLCEEIFAEDNVYTCEEIDAQLRKITPDDETYCQTHYNKTYKIDETKISINDKLPAKFGQLISKNQEVKDIWSGLTDDRSKADYRLGHLMFADGFTKEEAMSVLVNSAKALSRAPIHRISYAQNIADKIWTYEIPPDDDLSLSISVKDLLNRPADELMGSRLRCWRYIDNTYNGMRLGQVIGLVAGSGVGKTAMALNMFQGFVHNHPEYDHFFVPLEQPAREIADRWKIMCGENTQHHEKVQILSNYNDDGSYRHLSFEEIKDHIIKYQQKTNRKVGCVVIDHIGALNKKSSNGENQALMDICHQMKAFAIQTNTLLIMQSQAPREKASIGDVELDKDAAYGTVFFESYCDFLISIWQPLKRSYGNKACPAVTAFKFCKIRHKKKHLDAIQEDVRYRLLFDPATECMRELTQDEEKSFDFFNIDSTNKRKMDKKRDVLSYKSIPQSEGLVYGTLDNDKNNR